MLCVQPLMPIPEQRFLQAIISSDVIEQSRIHYRNSTGSQNRSIESWRPGTLDILSHFEVLQALGLQQVPQSPTWQVASCEREYAISFLRAGAPWGEGIPG